MSTFEIDFQEQNIRARIPKGSAVDGEIQYSTGLLLEGKASGKLVVNGAVVLLESGLLEGMVEIFGDAYVLGQMSVEKAVIYGVLHIGTGAAVSGFVQARDYRLHAGADVSASLNKLT
ncbi:polymer-forming cytoskeletal protein [Comamonas thiooxydans]|uniref:Polymer-forming cytoskeletal protein n=1 Tax=Comamonas thiooxydans TaxID=363952 RepID=A0A0E3B602_9BURK|nr:polymer-forming cytoskeletal protein [Comamonas thiooxydans]KGG81692.1 hypothetical protein P245_28030 [Comamonas thiooxydans]KGH23013.1 hypothetical protein P606_13345 [Comamonas thiooxydans]